MIAIRESNILVNKHSKTHTDFVAIYVKTMIEFYLEFFKALPKFYDKKVNDKAVVDNIMAIKTKHKVNHYKRLLKFALKAKTPLKNDDGLKIFKFQTDLCIPAKNNKAVVAALNDLLAHYREILEFEINGDSPAKITQYQGWQTTYAPINFLLNGIFDYEDWFLGLEPSKSWGPYQLAQALDIKSCPYCNRAYTFSLTDAKGAKKGRPDFDHFLPKNSNPLLALSFFNLIPSCKTCNGPSVKSAKPVSYETHLNPYEDNPKSGLMKFTYYPNTYEASIGLDDELDVFLNYAGDPADSRLENKTKGNIALFYLDNTYAHHRDTVQEIIRKRSLSNDRFIESLQNTFSHLNLSLEEAYRYAFGNYYHENDFHKRPLAKLTKDIAIEMGTLIETKKT